MDQGNYIKRASTWKFTEHDYHVQDNKYVLHTSVIISCVTTHFTEFSFCGMHVKSHGVIGLIKHYHLWLDTKLGHRNCAVRRITCACVTCNNTLGKTWDPGVYHTKTTDVPTFCWLNILYCVRLLQRLDNHQIYQIKNIQWGIWWGVSDFALWNQWQYGIICTDW